MIRKLIRRFCDDVSWKKKIYKAEPLIDNISLNRSNDGKEIKDPGSIVTLLDYQKFCDQRSGYEFEKLSARACADLQLGHELTYNSLGLAGEAGEFVEKIKKAIRKANLDDFYATLDKDKRLACLKELGDVMYYVARCSNLLNSNLEEVAEIHKNKLLDRIERGVVKGEGDER